MVRRPVTSRGFTLIEMLIVLLPMIILIGMCGSVLAASLRAWNSGCTRAGIIEDISYAIEKSVRDIDAMAEDSLSQYDSGNGNIAHTIQYDDLSGNTYVLYLYNAEDATLDSTYSQNSYDLLKANLTQGDNPGSGDGLLILRDLVSPDAAPPATNLTVGSTNIIIDLVVRRYDETARIRTMIRPRNL